MVSIDENKARLVIRGFDKKKWIDYLHTNSPTIELPPLGL